MENAWDIIKKKYTKKELKKLNDMSDIRYDIIELFKSWDEGHPLKHGRKFRMHELILYPLEDMPLYLHYIDNLCSDRHMDCITNFAWGVRLLAKWRLMLGK